MMMVDLLNRVSGSTSIAHTILIRLRLAWLAAAHRPTCSAFNNFNKNPVESFVFGHKYEKKMWGSNVLIIYVFEMAFKEK